MTRRRPRERTARGRSHVGERFEVEVGPVAHGGHCVARHDDRVVFVRHALPGERVVVSVTEGSEGDRFWRGDAVSVLSASTDRVTAPCPYAGPGLCGGCDFQHVTPAGQRGLKAAVVREQLSRLAGLDVEVSVEEVPPLLRWRTRMRYVALPAGARGLHVHRSDEVVEIDDCLIDAGLPARDSETVETSYGSKRLRVDPDGFWQSHLEAPRVLVETVLSFLAPRAGEKVLDLYAGVGLFAAFLSDVVGPSGRVVAVEGSRVACRDARSNLPASVTVEHGPVDRVLVSAYDEPFDLVVLDPPREGARRKVVTQIVDRAPRAVAYVACDPAALARDLATFAELGYGLGDLRAFDLFPMTQHVECVALLER
ncbi:MAG TPA: TRAM domain-containing protein [Nocardioides sp.]|uniref:class I SAM-dependent RNA methyltransferase n=1 Tax=Nocardioides sp. TaxID=35761 RepID=UPI002F3FF073